MHPTTQFTHAFLDRKLAQKQSHVRWDDAGVHIAENKWGGFFRFILHLSSQLVLFWVSVERGLRRMELHRGTPGRIKSENEAC